MDHYDATVIAKKQMRRKILHAFNLAHIHGEYSATLTMESLMALFVDVDAAYVRSDVRYLAEKGYIRRVNAEMNQKFEHWEFQLTATGKEQVDRILRDPAIDP